MNWFAAVAAIQFMFGFFVYQPAILDGALYLVLGFIFWKFKSRVAAVLLLLLSGAAIVVTFMNKISVQSDGGGTNLILAIIILYAAIRSVEAAFKWNKWNKK